MAVRTFGLLLVIAGIGVSAGCQGRNLSPQPGPYVELDTLRPTADFYARVDKPLTQSGSSLAGLNRENWADTTFYVPVAGVEHQPTYTTDRVPLLADSTARQRGEHPAQATAVEGTDEDSTLAQATEAVIGPFHAGWDVLWMIPKMIATPPDETVSSPRDGYQRRPHPAFATNGGLRDAGLGVTLKPLPAHAVPAPTTPAGEPLPPAGPSAQPPTPPTTPPTPAPAPTEPAKPTTEPAPATPPGGLPSGALGGGDSPKRKEPKQPPKEQPKEKEPPKEKP